MKLILLTTIVIGTLLFSVPSQADYIFLNSYNFTIPDHFVYKTVITNIGIIGNYVNIPSFKIKDVYFKIKDKIITAMIGFSGTAILNSSIEYTYSITFPLNDSYSITFGFNKDNTLTRFSVVQEWTIYNDISQTAIPAFSRFQGNSTTHLNGNEIYWKLNTSQFYDNLNLGSLFVQNTFVTRYQHQFRPAYLVTIQNRYYDKKGTETVIEDNQQGIQGSYNFASTLKSIIDYTVLVAGVLILIPLTIKRLRERRREKIRRSNFKEKVRSGKYNF